MKNELAVAFCLIAVLALAACSQPQDTSSPNSRKPAAESSIAAVPTSDIAAQGSLLVEPDSVSACDGSPRIKAHVSWDVAAPSVQQVKVMVSDAHSTAARLFSESGKKGSADTGDWVAAGTRFDLLNAADGAKLDSYTVKSEPCKSP